MKTWLKALIGITLSFMCIFTSVGYAKLTGELGVKGTVELTIPDAIYIHQISNVQTSNAKVQTTPTNIGYPSTKFMTEITFNSKNAYVTFDVVVVNGTQFNQFFDVLEEYPSMEGGTGSFSYNNVKWEVTPSQGTVVKSGEVVTFKVKLTYSGSSSNQTRRMLYELDFVLNSGDLTQAVSSSVTGKFEDILNENLTHDITYTYNNREETVAADQVYEAFVDHMESSISGKYIGNLEGADADDKALITALFEGALTFNVGNEEVPITVMVKEKNVYSSDTKEMVLYITADKLEDSGDYVPVYAAVFTKDSSGAWKQVGDIFKGEAQVNGYSGLGSLWGGTGSFNTEKWRSTEVYYGAAMTSSIDTIMDYYENQNK